MRSRALTGVEAASHPPDPRDPGPAFVHVDAGGTHVGNGGLVMLTQFANALADLGYRVSVFDHRDRLAPEHFEWLTLPVRFSFASVRDVLDSRAGPIVTNWITPLLPLFEARMAAPDGKDFVRRIRYWCQEELLTRWAGPAREFCRRYLRTIAINNGTLEMFYRAFGFRRLVTLWNWVRSDYFRYEGEAKIPNTVGIQPDWNLTSCRFLSQRIDPSHIVFCVGTQAQVAERMRTADLFVFWNGDHRGLFTGETIGMSLYEAMACGCVPVAIAHDGNRFLSGVVPLHETLADAVLELRRLMDDQRHKEELRLACLELVERRFRFDASRVDAIHEWFEDRP